MVNIVGLRNQLLNAYKELNNSYEKSQYFLRYEKEDMAKFGMIFEKVRQAGFLKTHHLWDIPKKKGQDIYKD